MVIDTNPEFGLELTLVIPYAYWLHQRGELEKVITSKGMKPFYYFCDNVEEIFETRTFEVNSNGLKDVPNDWIHHNSYVKKLSKADIHVVLDEGNTNDYSKLIEKIKEIF